MILLIGSNFQSTHGIDDVSKLSLQFSVLRVSILYVVHDSVQTSQHDHTFCIIFVKFFFHRNNGKISHKLPSYDAGNPINFIVIPYTPENPIHKNTGKNVYSIERHRGT